LSHTRDTLYPDSDYTRHNRLDLNHLYYHRGDSSTSHTMSLSSTSTLKGQLIKNLGSNAQIYFDALSSFVSGKTSRTEFEDVAKQILTTVNLCAFFMFCIMHSTDQGLLSTNTQCPHYIAI